MTMAVSCNKMLMNCISYVLVQNNYSNRFIVRQQLCSVIKIIPLVLVGLVVNHMYLVMSNCR